MNVSVLVYFCYCLKFDNENIRLVLCFFQISNSPKVRRFYKLTKTFAWQNMLTVAIFSGVKVIEATRSIALWRKAVVFVQRRNRKNGQTKIPVREALAPKFFPTSLPLQGLYLVTKALIEQDKQTIRIYKYEHSQNTYYTRFIFLIWLLARFWYKYALK